MKVLLAVDGSSDSDRAVERVAEFAWPAGTQVCLVTVDPPAGASFVGEPAVGVTAYDTLVQQQRADARSLLDHAADRLGRLAPSLSIFSVLLEGSPKDEIVAHAAKWAADVIVVGSRGRGAVTSVLLGSVSMGVSLNAPCSVLIVRDPRAER